MALISTPENPVAEIRRGEILPGTGGVRAERITSRGVYLTKEGAKRTFLPLAEPELNGKPWYYGESDTSNIRGKLELKKR